MTDIDTNSDSYGIDPCQISIPSVPLLAKSADYSNIGQVRIVGLKTFETSVERALGLADKMLKAVRKDLGKESCRELLKLLETRPEFSAHPWVREAVLTWIETGTPYTKRGRKIGSFGIHPLVVAALVDELVTRQWVPNKEKAFFWLADNNWLEYETAKKQYYQAIGEERFRAVMIQGSIWSTPTPRLKARRLIRRADRLHAGQSIVRTMYESPAVSLTMTITAT